MERKHQAKESAEKRIQESLHAQKENEGFEVKYQEVKEMRRKKFMACFSYG